MQRTRKGSGNRGYWSRVAETKGGYRRATAFGDTGRGGEILRMTRAFHGSGHF